MAWITVFSEIFDFHEFINGKIPLRAFAQFKARPPISNSETFYSRAECHVQIKLIIIDWVIPEKQHYNNYYGIPFKQSVISFTIISLVYFISSVPLL
jgi:hypothetical protein